MKDSETTENKYQIQSGIFGYRFAVFFKRLFTLKNEGIEIKGRIIPWSSIDRISENKCWFKPSGENGYYSAKTTLFFQGEKLSFRSTIRQKEDSIPFLYSPESGKLPKALAILFLGFSDSPLEKPTEFYYSNAYQFLLPEIEQRSSCKIESIDTGIKYFRPAYAVLAIIVVSFLIWCWWQLRKVL